MLSAALRYDCNLLFTRGIYPMPPPDPPRPRTTHRPAARGMRRAVPARRSRESALSWTGRLAP